MCRLLLVGALLGPPDSEVLREDCDEGLSNGEEAPDSRPFAILDTGEQHGDGGASEEQSHSTNVHSHKNWSNKHIHEVDSNAWEWVAVSDHLEGPLNVVETSGGACAWATDTFTFLVAHLEEEGLAVSLWEENWDDKSQRHGNAHKSAELEDIAPCVVLLLLEVALVKSREGNVGEEWLEGNVDPPKGGEPDVHLVFTLINHKILDKLEEFHRSEPVEACRNTNQPPTVSLPNATTKQDITANGNGHERESQGELFVETHWPPE